MEHKQHSDKKAAITFSAIRFIVSLGFTIMLFVAFMLLTARFTVVKHDVFETEANLLVQSLLYNRGGISYEDSATGRIYPGIIDLNKFSQQNQDETEQQLLYAVYYGEKQRHVAANITIEGMVEGNSLLYNRVQYLNWEPSTAFDVKQPSPGEVRSQQFRQYVLVRYPNGKLEGKFIEIKVLKQRT